jgi:Fe-Mn family superoxide dismutase
MFPQGPEAPSDSMAEDALFWDILTAGGGGAPSGELAHAIDGTFGSFENFVSAFERSAMAHQGSGWTWLVVGSSRDLFICSTANHDNPLMAGYVEKVGTPILVLDLWEHAYYLKYNNRKADHIKAFWQLVNFNKVAEMYQGAVGK